MHTLALQLAPVLAAEKSKVPFYIAGGLLVAWALVLALALGLRRPDFPGSAAGERAVIAISVGLVLAAVSTAVITSGAPAKSASAAPTQTEQSAPAPVASVPSGAATQPATTATASSPASPAAGKAGSSLALAANPSGALSYDTKTLSAKAGTVTITMTNMSPLEHNVTVAQGSKVLGATPTFVDGSRTLTLTLKPGKYTFYCSVPGHRQAGMEGTLSVS
jgi:plastocyanin